MGLAAIGAAACAGGFCGGGGGGGTGAGAGVVVDLDALGVDAFVVFGRVGDRGGALGVTTEALCPDMGVRGDDDTVVWAGCFPLETGGVGT